VFAGEREVRPGVRVPTGVYRSSLRDCHVGDDCLIRDVRLAANLIVEHNAAIVDVGSITCSEGATFGCGPSLVIVPENGGRALPVWAEVTVDAAAAVLHGVGCREGQGLVQAQVRDYVAEVASPFGWVQEGATVVSVPTVEDCFIGPAARIDGAQGLRRSCVLSNPEEPTAIGSGAEVVDSIVQWGSTVSGHAIVHSAVLLEHSHVAEHATVVHSVLGPGTSVGKGEVTASLLGPLTAAHHQSLLIAALWPQGRGNVAYGAHVGSNHSGRVNDQEIWPAEGMFFGLGCLIRFPADYSRAPYTVVAAGVTTLPQRLTLPFSLIAAPREPGEGLASGLNELMPGWVLGRNAYAVARAEGKFRARDRSRRHAFDPAILRSDLGGLVRDALVTLEAAAAGGVKKVYVDSDCPGLGKNFMTEEGRCLGVQAYTDFLRRLALRRFLDDAVSIGPKAALSKLSPKAPEPVGLLSLLEAERRFVRNVAASKRQDDVRGPRIIADYGDCHVQAEADPVVVRAEEELQAVEARMMAFLKDLGPDLG